MSKSNTTVIGAESTKEFKIQLQDKNNDINILQNKLSQLESELIKNRKNEELFNSRIMKLAARLVQVSIFTRSLVYRLKSKIRKGFARFTPTIFKRVASKVFRVLFVRRKLVSNIAIENRDSPLVSIVTPYYNSSNTIQQTVDSVLGQTFQNFEYIIVNDGSTSEEATVLDKIKHAKVKVVNLKENIGKGSPAAARNYGIEMANGRYIICLDSDDIIDPMYIEKGVTILETHPWLSIFSSYTKAFGETEEDWNYIRYDPRELIHNNMLITASMFRRDAWQEVGGYKEGIGYEDWEFWINLAENSHYAQIIPERLFKYRTALSSRYIEDNKNHKANITQIHALHPEYMRAVKKRRLKTRRLEYAVNPETAFLNLNEHSLYQSAPKAKESVLIAMSWMAFGGAETLILNFSRELADDYNITFMTGLESDHVWQDRFEQISPNIYHLANLFEDKQIYLEFMSNYILTRDIKILHILHTDFAHDFLKELKKRHPNLKIIVTMFNSRVEHFPNIKEVKDYVDNFTSDNMPVVNEYKKLGIGSNLCRVIPNGIDSTVTFNPSTYDQQALRKEYKIAENDIAVFFIGRLSEEKNPDVFLKVAEILDTQPNYKNLKLFVVGDGPMRNEIEKKAKQLSNVEFLGYRTDIGAILSMSDVFILPSSIEGFPLSILEAMAMENVCIASSVGAVPNIVEEGKTGFVVEPGNVNAIVDSLYYLHDNHAKLSSMQAEARDAVVKLYSNQILGRNYKKLYKDTLEK